MLSSYTVFLYPALGGSLRDGIAFGRYEFSALALLARPIAGGRKILVELRPLE